MLFQKPFHRLTRFIAALALVASLANLGFSQGNNNNNNNGGGNGGGNNNNGDSGNGGGVEIDPQGVLRISAVDNTLALRVRKAALQTVGNTDVVASEMRKVSLNRLEKLVANRVSEQQELGDEVLGLAGLTRIEYVFFLPDSNDIVIAGPAEKIHVTENGNRVGLKSGRSVLSLMDLIVALRVYAPSNDAIGSIAVSIEPTQEGIKRMNQYNDQFRGRANQINPAVLAGMKQALGYQNVIIKGVPRETNFARVLVEADYRMKLIGLGLENTVIPFKPWIARTQAGANASALQRWYFEADYGTVATNEDRTALHLQGQGAKLTSEKEFLSKSGERTRGAGAGDAASVGFAKEFSQKFEALGEVMPVFSQMRNLFDMSIVAAFMQQNDFYGKANWDLGVFADEEKLSTKINNGISQVEPAVNAMWKEGTLVTPIGGVHISARKLANDPKVDNTLDASAEKLSAPSDLREDQWWWD